MKKFLLIIVFILPFGRIYCQTDSIQTDTVQTDATTIAYNKLMKTLKEDEEKSQKLQTELVQTITTFEAIDSLQKQLKTNEAVVLVYSGRVVMMQATIFFNDSIPVPHNIVYYQRGEEKKESNIKWGNRAEIQFFDNPEENLPIKIWYPDGTPIEVIQWYYF